jgi:phosphate starvation-inducible PhoH-like protein
LSKKANARQKESLNNNLEDNENNIFTKKPKIEFKNENQGKLWNCINENEIVICAGSAGVGKSYLSVLKAIDLLFDRDKKYKQIIIIKPVVEADEHLGALPGSVEEKLEPYTFSTFYLFEKALGKRKVEKLVERGYIRVLALAYLRGMNIDNSIVICEECQNMSIRQLKTLLTRIGENSKFILNGDLDQSDRFKNRNDTALYDSMNRFKNIKNLAIFEFDKSDIVRNPIIEKILERYEK